MYIVYGVRVMKKLKIALLQIEPAGSCEENLKKGILYCKKAKEMGADIALFPEMYSNGYNIYERPSDEWIKEAINIVTIAVHFGEQCNIRTHFLCFFAI